MCDYSEIKSKTVVVRKVHQCGWCARPIHKGDAAQHRAYVFQGEFTNDYMHPECFSAMNESHHDVRCDGWMPGDFERGEVAEAVREWGVGVFSV